MTKDNTQMTYSISDKFFKIPNKDKTLDERFSELFEELPTWLTMKHNENLCNMYYSILNNIYDLIISYKNRVKIDDIEFLAIRNSLSDFIMMINKVEYRLHWIDLYLLQGQLRAFCDEICDHAKKEGLYVGKL